MTKQLAERKLRRIIEETSDPEVARLASEASEDLLRSSDPYDERVSEFHDALEESGGGDFLTVLADAFDPGDLPVPADTPQEAERMLAEVMAERNRFFWSSFLAEETGEVASCLNDGEPPEDFEEEVADVAIITFGIADAFGFDMMKAFHDKMDENDRKPKRQEGTGKLPPEAREDWRGDE